MNNIKPLGLGMLLLCFGCTTDCCLYKTSAKIYLINETSTSIKSNTVLGYTIKPGDTLIHTETYETEWSQMPTVKTYQPFANTVGRTFFYEGSSKCETGMLNIENYENVKEVSDLNFELTFHFTDEKKENAETCN